MVTVATDPVGSCTARSLSADQQTTYLTNARANATRLEEQYDVVKPWGKIEIDGSSARVERRHIGDSGQLRKEVIAWYRGRG